MNRLQQQIILSLFVVSFLTHTSCNKNYCPASAEISYIRIDESLPVDSSVLKFIQPYSTQLSATMNRVIGICEVELSKAKPESSLGNFFADALREQSEKHFERKIDLCVMNYGGLRLPNISAGNITVGTVFELMPFDNYLSINRGKVYP